MRTIHCCTVLMLALVMLASCASPRTRSLFVVPVESADGDATDAQRVILESWLVDRAGGFTDMGEVDGAWRAPSGEIVREKSRLYLVTTKDHPEQFEDELRERILRDFEQEEAYIERW